MTSNRERVVATFVGAAVVLVFAAVVGAWLRDRVQIRLEAAPLFARWSPRLGAGFGAVAVAAFLVWFDRAYADRFRFTPLLLIWAVGAAAWGTSLALFDGVTGLTMGITGRFEYLVNVERAGAGSDFVRTFTERIGDYTAHVRGHPPGTLLGLILLDRVGLATPAVAAGLVVVAAASIAPAAMVAAREIVDEPKARRAAPFLVLAPAAIWLVTSFDAAYAAVGAWGICLVTLATSREGRTSDALALAGGTVLGVGLFMSYGLAPLLVVPCVVLFARRRVRNAVAAAAGGLFVAGAFAASGFWWLDGLASTRAEYFDGVASVRPYWYFFVANIAAFAIAVGIGPLRGIASLDDRRLWLLCGSTLAVVALANLSGLSKGEVERIWLPFWPWVALAAAAIPDRERHAWLCVQAATVIALQSVLFMPW